MDTAATVGSIWSRMLANIRRVRVELSPPTINSAITTSSKEAMNAKSAPEKIDRRICGRVTLRNAQVREAPRLRAAISWFMSNP
ncbi:hypothetical protein D3C84_1112290 [compost metagenome]